MSRKAGHVDEQEVLWDSISLTLVQVQRSDSDGNHTLIHLNHSFDAFTQSLHRVCKGK